MPVSSAVCTAEPPASSQGAKARGEVNQGIGREAGEEQQSSGENAVRQQPLVRMRVPYARSMLVVVAAEGVAALRFSEPFELNNDTGNGVAGIDYEWRFLAREKDAAEKTGAGRVFVKLVDGKVAHGSFGLDCGPLSLTWGFGDDESGTVAFDPRVLAVHPAPERQFKVEPKELLGGALIQGALDLNHFLSPIAGTGETGADADPARPAVTVAGFVPYDDSVVVVRTSSGIAAITFGEAFEREPKPDEKHYGVRYRFQIFLPAGETADRGKGEVYERYTDGKYDDGQLELQAGPLDLTWSRGGESGGWVYYDPSETPVFYVNAEDTKPLVTALRQR